MTDAEEESFKGALGNLMAGLNQQAENMRILIGVVGELRQRIDALEQVRRERPSLVNVHGERMN